MSDSSFFVSAPGKVIIFGEHSAVYGKPAIAAALSLRAYLLVTPNEDPDTITLDFPDIKLSQSWNKNTIPWDQIKTHIQYKDGKPMVTDELNPEVVGDINESLRSLESRLHHTACYSFLYLYVHLCNKSLPGMRYCVRSTLPIGAGLGSSAAVSVCLASALAKLGGYVSTPQYNINDKVPEEESSNADFINGWSLMSEKCFHGNPSGIDNSVATHGGAVMFQRMLAPAQPSVRITMRNFPSLKLLLTNTKVPRSTAYLVANVGRINTEYPKIASSILEAMEHLASDAYQIMIRPYFGAEERKALRELVNINHGLLVSLGVSHPSLEKIKIITDSHNIGATKLTGAGGGGCGITLVNDDVEEEVIHEAIADFLKEGFETFETTLGGKGAALLLLQSIIDSKKEIFDPNVFMTLKSREDIEEYLAVDRTEGWKFW